MQISLPIKNYLTNINVHDSFLTMEIPQMTGYNEYLMYTRYPCIMLKFIQSILDSAPRRHLLTLSESDLKRFGQQMLLGQISFYVTVQRSSCLQILPIQLVSFCFIELSWIALLLSLRRQNQFCFHFVFRKYKQLSNYQLYQIQCVSSSLEQSLEK